MKEFNFYIDDSGTRNPDRKTKTSFFGDWFALGGIILAGEDEQLARDLHAAFCEKWKIDYPLHSIKIRHRSDKFAWVGSLDQMEQNLFYSDLNEMIQQSPVLALACVIDRPGYNARYAEKYGRQPWSLCKTSFPIIAERAAKFAREEQRRVRLFVERSDRVSEGLIRAHFNELRKNGMPFANGGDPKYAPLDAPAMQKHLYDLKFKSKSSPMMQLADLMLYPLCKAGYEDGYRPYDLMKNGGKLIEARLPDSLAEFGGTKYSCFDALRPRSISAKK
jgi:hypothetical protein